MFKLFFSCLCALFIVANGSFANEIRVAVASNFTAPAKKLAQRFEQMTGHSVKLSFGATGSFYAQLSNGAPFDVFLSADETTPQTLINQGLGVPTSAFIYAQGRLVLWSKNPALINQQGDPLTQGHSTPLAVADPKLAPYGRAAEQVLTQLNLTERYKNHRVIGTNIGQTYQFVYTENAPIGLIALSQVYQDGHLTEGSAWIIPEDLYTPINQVAVIVTHTEQASIARAFLEFLRSPEGIKIIESYGYRVPN